MAGCTSLCVIDAKAGLLYDAWELDRPSLSSLADFFCTHRRQLLPIRLKVCQHAGSALYPVSDSHLQDGRRIEQHVYSGSKLNHADPLATGQSITDLFIKNNAPSKQPRNLLEHYPLAFTPDRNNILLILLRAIGAHGVHKFSALISNIANYSRNRGAVHVYIKHIQENADPHLLRAPGEYGRDISHLPVCGRNDGAT